MTQHGDELLAARQLMSVSADILKGHGLTMIGWLVLDMMCGTGDPEMVNDFRQSEVANKLDLTNNDARRTLSRLEEDGLVERLSVQHVFRFSPSPKGEQVYREALKEMTG